VTFVTCIPAAVGLATGADLTAAGSSGAGRRARTRPAAPSAPRLLPHPRERAAGGLPAGDLLQDLVRRVGIPHDAGAGPSFQSLQRLR